ncbi:MAG TPA: glycosyltransferase [Verrucomicrobiae bacterium]|jgi:glycosyltransferase involved in cell wall biosynthesis|nr:glycosyltransferase [Verrucomicrobiae bacterium]
MKETRIKLFKFVTTFDIGGTERHVVNLVRRLDPELFDIAMGCLHKQGPFLKDIERLQIPVEEYSIGSFRSRKALQEQLRCARAIRSRRFDIVHTYGFYSNVFGIPAAKLGGATHVIASIRDTLEFPPLQSAVHKFVCRMAEYILVNADIIRRRLIAEGYNGEKIRVIKNGIDLSRFRPKDESGKLRQELGLYPTAPVVVVLARLSKIKGIEYFLEAAAAVAKRFEEARFLIVGDLKDDPAYKATLKRQAIRLGLGRRVIFTGFRLDIPEILSEATISVLPCHTGEGLSNSILESMGAGLPVVATTVGGNPELVEDGKTGILVPPRDSGALAGAISLLLADSAKARRFGAAGKERAAKEFSLERMARTMGNFYLQLMNREICEPVSTVETERRYAEAALHQSGGNYPKIDLPPVS